MEAVGGGVEPRIDDDRPRRGAGRADPGRSCRGSARARRGRRAGRWSSPPHSVPGAGGRQAGWHDWTRTLRPGTLAAWTPPRRSRRRPCRPIPPARTSTGSTGWTLGRVAAVVVVLAIVLMWIYAFSAWPPGPARPARRPALRPGGRARLRRHGRAARRAAVGPRRRLARAAPSPCGRPTPCSPRWWTTSEALVPDSGDRDERITGLWLDDWRTHLDDRAAYADALADGGTDAPSSPRTAAGPSPPRSTTSPR